MEILIKAKQGDNPQFQFMNKDASLHAYYTSLIGLIKSGKWPEKKVEVVEEKPPENDEYLHPSLASAIIESAPAIPSIHYKPSADCDYTLLINKMRGDGEEEASSGDVPPPGTELATPPAHIYRPPVLYGRTDDNNVNATQPAQTQQYQQYSAYYQQYASPPPPQEPIQPVKKDLPVTTLKSTGLSLMKNYNTDSDSDVSDFDDSSSTDSKDQQPPIETPPEEVQVVVDKMAAYVARNGDEFEDIVRAKNDPRFTFLEPDNVYHAYYRRLMQQKRGVNVNGKDKKRKHSAPVSFSIKKLKEPEPMLPKPALPYESSTDDESEKQTDQPEDQKDTKPVQQATLNPIPTAVVYKMEGQLTKDLPTVRTIEPMSLPKTVPKPVQITREAPVLEEKAIKPIEEVKTDVVQDVKKTTDDVKQSVPEKKEDRDRDSPFKRKSPQKRDSPPRREKKKYREHKKELSKSEREYKRERRSVDREKKRDKENSREKKRVKYSKEEETEIISLDDNPDEFIDLTGDLSDTKGEGESEADIAKQQERRRRAAMFLKKVGVDPAAATTLPTSSLASAMVDTLESIRKKKAEEEEKRRRREKRRHRTRHDYDEDADRSHRKSKRRKYRSSDDNGESDYDSSKKKKRKKEKKHSTKIKRKRRHESDSSEAEYPPVNIDLTNTLKELRTASPTKDILQNVEDTQQSYAKEESSEEEIVRDKRRKEREYSEGEWSSDTEADSKSSVSAKE